MSPRVVRWLTNIWLATLGLAGAAVTLLVALHEWKHTKWPPDSLIFWSVLAVAVATTVDKVVGIFRRYRARERSKAEARTQKALVALLVEISESKHVNIQDLGVSVFVPRWRVWRWGSGRVLVRVMRFRLDDHPQPSPVRWTKGKGAVGSCWETARMVHRPWRTQRAEYSSPSLTAEEFSRIPTDEQDGFEHREFVAIADKYSEVLAAPVLSEVGAIVGVVSVDVAARAGVFKDILKDGVEAQIDAAATLIRDDLGQLYAQS